jgi:methionyl-tRNA formyltransferase
VLARPARLSTARRLRRYLSRYTLSQLLSRVRSRLYALRTRSAARREETFARHFSPAGGATDFQREDLVRVVPRHNGRACLDLLRSLEPDVIAVYGTAIIREPMIATARCVVLNMHTGISPRYRGSDTIFWALHNAEPEWVGVTVHILDAGIDSGPILGVGRPIIAAGDDEFSLFCKCVIVGCDLYVDAIRKVVDDGMRGTPQRLEEGRQYRFVDRTVAAERQVERLLRDGLLRRHERLA